MRTAVAKRLRFQHNWRTSEDVGNGEVNDIHNCRMRAPTVAPCLSRGNLSPDSAIAMGRGPGLRLSLRSLVAATVNTTTR